jgi:hypothetical protein
LRLFAASAPQRNVPNGAVTRELHAWWLGLRVLFARHDRVAIPAMDVHFECGDHAGKVEALGRASSWVHADYNRAALLDDTFRRYGVSLAEIDDAYFLDAEQLRALARHPSASVGAHTVSHRPLSLLSDAEAREELAGNRRFLEGLLDRAVTDLAYPYGNPASCGEREFAVAAQTGFRSAVTTRYGALIAADRDRLHALPRVAAGGASGFHAFATAVAAL